MKHKIYRGGEDNYPFWWYGQSNRLQNFGDRPNFLTPNGPVFKGDGYYFDGIDDYMEDIYGRHLFREGTKGLWSQIYLTDSTVPPCGSAVGTGDKLLLSYNQAPLITGNFILHQEFCPNLIKLDIHTNDIRFVDISEIKTLQYLSVGYNYKLAPFDVSLFTLLTYLNVHGSEWDELDVANLVHLTQLDCGYCRYISILDVSNLNDLTYLSCYSNLLSALDVSQNSQITYLDCHNNQLDQSAVDKVLCDANAWNTSGGTLNISGNTAPSQTGIDCKNEMVNRNWTITTD